jgi:hypothetical protein
LILLVLLAVGLVAVPAGASTFLAMTQDELVRDSAAVIQGRVLQVNSYWEKTGTVIVTEALIQVEDTVFGDVPTVVAVKTFGGRVGNFYVEAHGFPTFRVNQRVLLFLEPDQDGDMRVTGYQQGQFRISMDKAGREMAVPALDLGANLLTKDGRALPRQQTLPLDTLKDQIRAAAVRAGRATE